MSKFNPIILALNVLSLVAFYMMVTKHEEVKYREYFFYAFSSFLIGIYIIGMYAAYMKLTDAKAL